MLETLHLRNLGPGPELSMALGPRLNLVTGDNGLGKTLLLDCAWYALTRTWPLTWGGRGVIPDREGARIDWRERRGSSVLDGAHAYQFDRSAWTATTVPDPLGKVELDGPVVVYLRVDGGISIHDPLRLGEHFRLPARQVAMGQSHAFQFREAEIWDGLHLDDGRDAPGPPACEGLIRDVARWALERDSAEFTRLEALVHALAGEERFRLTGKVARVFIDDARDYPLIDGPTGTVPVAHAPAGLRRILSLAYLLVWAAREHRVAASLKRRDPSDSLVLLIDEVEGHLHPKWQRTILPSLLRSLGADMQVQVIATTHSPLVLASMEPWFDVERDKLFAIELAGGSAVLQEQPWTMQGDVLNWLKPRSELQRHSR